MRCDINYRIEKLFRERHIEIPYPTQEFLLKNVDDSVVRSAFNPERQVSQDQDRAGNTIPGEKLPKD